MKRWVSLVVFAILFLILGMVAGAFLVSANSPEINATVVEVKNVSNLTIKRLVLTHEHGTIEINNLTPKQTQTLAFFPGGEDTYLLKAYFEDGRIIEGGGGYVEPGYAMREMISASKIDTHYGL